MTFSAAFESHGFRFGLRSNHPALPGRLPALLPPASRRCDPARVEREFSLWLDPAGPAQGDAFERLESELRCAVATHARGHTFVHAGAVGWRGRAILIPGRSRAGKTTLVAELVKAGAAYLSDEYAVLDPRGGVHPFAKRLSLRGPGGCDRHLRRPSAEELGGCAARGRLAVGMVLVTEHRRWARWRPRPLTAGQALLELLAHTVPARLRPQRSLAALSAAVAGAVCLKGPRGEAASLAPRLLELAERAWGDGGGAA